MAFPPLSTPIVFLSRSLVVSRLNFLFRVGVVHDAPPFCGMYAWKVVTVCLGFPNKK